MLAGIGTGIASCLGAILAVAGLLKALDVTGTRRALSRLLPRGRRASSASSRWLAWTALLLALAEIGLGVALLLAPRARAVDALALALFAAFPFVVRRARRLGAACGCFGSFSTRVSGPKEAARAAALAVCAAAMFGLNAVWGADQASWMFAIAGFGAASAAVVLAAALAPPRRARPWRRRPNADRQDPAAWRPTQVWNRIRVLRRVRTDPQVREVLARGARRVRWRRAKVAVSGRPVRMTQVLVSGEACALHVIIPVTGRPAVILFTPEGPLVPGREPPGQRRAASAAETVAEV
ncbi:MAG TPA: MauE/DoxX family redox-associated membrane protein [Actinocrinis sp.]